MKAVGIKNIKTLTRWHKEACVIPPPTVEKHPGGIGRTAFWPAWVLQHCRQIKQLTNSGQTLANIAASFGTDWETIANYYKRRYVFSEASKKMAHNNKLIEISQHIEKTLTEWIVSSRQRLSSTALHPILFDVAIQAIDLATEGYNPVLVLCENRTVVVQDFLVSHYLSDHFQNTGALLVIPLHSILQQFDLDGIPEEPTVHPSRKIKQSGKRSSTEEVIDVSEEWTFTKLKPKRKPKRKK